MGNAAEPVALHEYACRGETVKECLATFARFLKSAPAALLYRVFGDAAEGL
jgi:hypothetical protein